MDGKRHSNIMDKYREIEVKFKIDEGLLNPWKQLVSELKHDPEFNYKNFLYVESEDIYYTKQAKNEQEYRFIRHRFSEDPTKRRAELTSKIKLKDSNNIIRKEWNIRVDNNTVDTIKAWVEDGLGFKRNFSINKFVHIYNFEDATLPFYTVIDENNSRQSFIEIEVNEELINKISDEQAFEIIKKYESKFESLGITSRNRLKLSLFEMYKKE